MIEVTNLTKKYGDHIAVDNLSFRVEKGQIYGFLGPNGAGKSTTMNIITGYLAASAGAVKINGHDVLKDAEEAKKCIGYLPELPPLYMDMTVLEYLKFVAELKKVPKKDRMPQIEEIMLKTGIADMKGRLIRNLSKGYRQRVGLAQAMVGYPEVIILDEPSVGLDPKQIIEIRELIRSLGEKHTVILSSHILSEVSAVCDHIMIIAHGKLVASDSPENLQKLMGGSSELQIVVRGEAEKVMEVLAALENVDKVEKDICNEEGCCKVKVITASDVDVKEQVFFKLAGEGMPIMSMNKVEKTLEDIFLELTGEVSKQEVKKKSLFGRKPKKEAEQDDNVVETEAEIPADEEKTETNTVEEPSEVNEAVQNVTEPVEPFGEAVSEEPKKEVE